ncbi:MAG: Swt1 family HEPN domain-containing protein [Planctomycetota bacterium]|nr:Swt1 family HEPN domain-containing protein [Planctomycetota bacterium]MDA1247964.1 Swt1 family HEPN domain-containing protein [Planctomycetota bacterium]
MNSYQDIVTGTLDSLTVELREYVVAQLKVSFKDDWLKTARNSFRNDRTVTKLSDDTDEWDAHALLTIMWDHWNAAFRSKLGLFERSLVAELRAFRNRWAHQRGFNFDDTYRLLDSTQRLLSAIGAENVTAISELKFQLLRDEFGESINEAARDAENDRERWVVAFVYSMCGGIFVYLLFRNFGTGAWPMGVSMAVGFLFLIWKRVTLKVATIGPRECRRCRRIIYGTTCPYCAGGAGFDSEEYRLGETEVREVEDEQPASN